MKCLLLFYFEDGQRESFINTICISDLCEKCLPKQNPLVSCSDKWADYESVTMPVVSILNEQDFCDLGSCKFLNVLSVVHQ